MLMVIGLGLNLLALATKKFMSMNLILMLVLLVLKSSAIISVIRSSNLNSTVSVDSSRTEKILVSMLCNVVLVLLLLSVPISLKFLRIIWTKSSPLLLRRVVFRVSTIVILTVLRFVFSLNIHFLNSKVMSKKIVHIPRSGRRL